MRSPMVARISRSISPKVENCGAIRSLTAFPTLFRTVRKMSKTENTPRIMRRIFVICFELSCKDVASFLNAAVIFKRSWLVLAGKISRNASLKGVTRRRIASIDSLMPSSRVLRPPPSRHSPKSSLRTSPEAAKTS